MCRDGAKGRGDGGDAWSPSIGLSVLRVMVVIDPRLQVQVSLKSSPEPAVVAGMSELLTIGEVARRSGVAASALRYYEERGLIASERAGSGHRRFRRPVLRRIAFIVFAQRIGLTLEEIAVELAGSRATAPRAAATGRCCRAPGRRGSRTGSPSSSG